MSEQDPIDHIEMYQRNIKEIQSQLQQAYIRIGELNEQLSELKRIKDGKGSTPRDNS